VFGNNTPAVSKIFQNNIPEMFTASVIRTTTRGEKSQKAVISTFLPLGLVI
jgi:hypothetical protein